uniref:Protein BZR1 homolog n=1 Tax=Oryza meridionalis TaxID=40149 RepID=A0A0E0BYS8_9ORYZ
MEVIGCSVSPSPCSSYQPSPRASYNASPTSSSFPSGASSPFLPHPNNMANGAAGLVRAWEGERIHEDSGSDDLELTLGSSRTRAAA